MTRHIIGLEKFVMAVSPRKLCIKQIDSIWASTDTLINQNVKMKESVMRVSE